MIVDRTKNPKLYGVVHNANLLRQYDLLATKVLISLEMKFIANFATISDLNFVAVVDFPEDAGKYRFSTNSDVYIKDSTHTPPKAPEIHVHVRRFVDFVNTNWHDSTLLEMPAYALWKINWIHPFSDGNGRTAQAISYYFLCLKAGRLLGGGDILPKLIRENQKTYCRLLGEMGDSHASNGESELENMIEFLGRLLKLQLSS